MQNYAVFEARMFYFAEYVFYTLWFSAVLINVLRLWVLEKNLQIVNAANVVFSLPFSGTKSAMQWLHRGSEDLVCRIWRSEFLVGSFLRHSFQVQVVLQVPLCRWGIKQSLCQGYLPESFLMRLKYVGVTSRYEAMSRSVTRSSTSGYFLTSSR